MALKNWGSFVLKQFSMNQMLRVKLTAQLPVMVPKAALCSAEAWLPGTHWAVEATLATQPSLLADSAPPLGLHFPPCHRQTLQAVPLALQQQQQR